MPGLAKPVVQVVGDDAIGAVAVGQVVGVAGVGRGGPLLLLGGDRPEPGLVDDRVGFVRLAAVSGVAGMVIGMSCAVRLVAVRRHAVDPRADQDGEQESGQRQRRDERDEVLDRHRLIP